MTNKIVGDFVIVQPCTTFRFRIDGAHDKLVILLDAAPLAFGIHPDHGIMRLAGRLGFTGEIFDL